MARKRGMGKGSNTVAAEPKEKGVDSVIKIAAIIPPSTEPVTSLAVNAVTKITAIYANNHNTAIAPSSGMYLPENASTWL